MEKTVKLLVRERTRKSDGQKFNTFHVVDKNGKLLTVRFTKEVTRPDETCMMTFDSANANISFAREYPELWVKKAEFSEIERTDNLDDYI